MNPPNQTIAGRYRLEQHLRYVSEANYYAALDLVSGQLVTVRTINISEPGAVGPGLEHLAAQKLQGKVRNEQKLVQALKSLAHPNLLALLDDGFEDPLYYHVYPAMAFDSLQTRLEQAPALPLVEACGYALQASRLLADLHARSIVHCDVSAETLLLVQGQVKLAEFSIANFEPAEGVAPGNPFYMSPEAIAGAPPAPPRDVWALGVTLAYVLSGSLPFQPPSDAGPAWPPALFHRILSEAPQIETAHLPPSLAALLQRMLAKDPDSRPAPLQVAGEIESILEENRA